MLGIACIESDADGKVRAVAAIIGRGCPVKLRILLLIDAFSLKYCALFLLPAGLKDSWYTDSYEVLR